MSYDTAARGASPFARAFLTEIQRDTEALAELAGLLVEHLPPAEDRWMGTREAAAYLGLTPNALHKLTSSRTVPFHQDVPGGKCWFLKSELDAWRRA